MRLRTLPLSFSVILTGSAMTWYYTQFVLHWWQDQFSWSVFSLTLLTTLFLQILSNLANDYGDALKGADNENRIGPERAIQSGIITAKEMKNAVILFSILSFISGITLLLVAFEGAVNYLFLLFILLGILAIAAAIKYTVGKGAYGYYALGDAFVFIFFGFVGVCGSYYLQAMTIHIQPIIASICMGAFAVAVLNLNNMRDRVNDQAVGKRTLAVLLGFKGSKIYHSIILLIGWSPILYQFYIIYPNDRLLFLYLSPVLIIHIIHLIKVFRVKDPKSYDPELKKIALSTFLMSLIIFMDAIFDLS